MNQEHILGLKWGVSRKNIGLLSKQEWKESILIPQDLVQHYSLHVASTYGVLWREAGIGFEKLVTSQSLKKASIISFNTAKHHLKILEYIKAITLIRKGKSILIKVNPTYQLGIDISNIKKTSTSNVVDNEVIERCENIVRNFIPESQMNSASIRGIYFLYNEYELVYIGQSKSIINRLAQHLSSEKVFTHYTYLSIQDENIPLEIIERMFIEKYLPIFNVDPTTEKIRLNKKIK